MSRGAMVYRGKTRVVEVIHGRQVFLFFLCFVYSLSRCLAAVVVFPAVRYVFLIALLVCFDNNMWSNNTRPGHVSEV